MKRFFFISSILLLSSCFHFDHLDYYVVGYSPNNDSLRTDGFYYQHSPDSSTLRAWPNAIRSMYFLKNGTFIYEGNCDVENVDSLDTWLCKNDQRMFDGSYFGQYTISNDTLLIEWLVPKHSFIVRLNAFRVAYKALRTESGIRIFEVDGSPCNEEWIFHENTCVPDSVKNWITKHRKYRLD